MKNFISLALAVTLSSAAQAQSRDPNQLPKLSEKSVYTYLSQLSSLLTGRPLNPGELDQIRRDRQKAIAPILQNWVYSPTFSEAAKLMLQTQLLTSGAHEGVNHELPGNLAKYLARNVLPYSNILTADYCVDNDLNKIRCDSGAPYAAGVLTTRAYLLSNSGRFNLGRANKMLHHFACKEYPLEKDLQIPIAKDRLIPLFQTEKASSGADFGNGLACYTCHSQFGAHAQLFVKFDAFGIYRPEASGLQDPQLEAGKSVDNLYASHLLNSSEAQSEQSQMFGKEVKNLSEAAQVLAKTDMFLECSARNAIRFFLRMTDSEASVIDKNLLKSIVRTLKKKSKDPSLNEILLQALQHPIVIQSALASGEAP